MTKITYIPGEIANAAIDENGNRKPVTRTQHIFDDALNKPQSQVNVETTEAISDEVTRAKNAESGLDTRLQTVEELAEISIDGGSIGIATGDDFVNPTAEQRAKVPTVGAILDGADDEPTAGSDNMVKSGGVVKLADSHSLSDNALFNKYIRSIIKDGDTDVTNPIRGNIGAYVQSTQKYVNTIFDAANHEILVERFDTQQEAFDSIVNNPIKIYNGYEIRFNSKAVMELTDYFSYNNVTLNFPVSSKEMHLLSMQIDDIANKEGKNAASSKSVANIGVINVTADYPLQSGYYQINDSNGDNYAPAVIPENRRIFGTILVFRASSSTTSIYKFTGGSLDFSTWLRKDRWANIITSECFLERTTDIPSGRIGEGTATPNVTGDTGQILNLRLGTEGGCNTYFVPLSAIRIDGLTKDFSVKDINGNPLTRFSTLNTKKYYRFLSDGSSYVLLNEDKDYIKTGNNSYNLYKADELAIGNISTSGANGTVNTRLRTKASYFYKAPIRLYVKPGYLLFMTFKYTENAVTYTTDNKAGYIDITEEGLYRFAFRKTDNSEFTTVEDVCDVVGVNENIEKLDLTNVENIITIGTSHTAGHSVIPNKSFIPYLSALYDWNFVNLGTDGNNYIQELSYIINDTVMSCGSKFSDKPNNGGICLDFLGGSAEYPYWQTEGQGNNMEINIRRLYSVLKSYGYDIIIGSYFDHNYSIANVQNRVAEELALQFVNIHNECMRIGGDDKKFTPYYYAGHYASRTVALQFYTFWKYAKIRRPRTAIKIYRNRNSVTDISELLYNDVFERIKLWNEISINHKALQDNRLNYVDRLDQYYAEGKRDIAIDSEYTTLKNGSYIMFQEKALVEFVLPATANGLKDLHLVVNQTKDVNIYIRKYIDTNSVIPLVPAQCIFLLTSTTGINVGDVFTDTYIGNGIRFTVTDIQGSNVYCDSSEPISLFPGQIIDTLTRVSDSATYECTSIRQGAPADYQDRKNEPFGIWKQIDAPNNVIYIEDATPYMDYDKISLLVESTDGTSFGLRMPSAFYKVKDEKQKDKFYSLEAIKPNNSGESVLVDKFGLSGDTVGEYGTIENIGTSYAWDGNETYVLNGFSLTKNHIPQYYSNTIGCNSILHLKSGTSVHYHIPEFAQGNTYAATNRVFKVTLVARYFPASNLDTSAVSFTITPQTFDFGRIGIKSPINTGSMFFSNIQYAPASWVELNAIIMLDSKASDDLIIEALDNDVELLYIKVEELL